MGGILKSCHMVNKCEQAFFFHLYFAFSENTKKEVPAFLHQTWPEKKITPLWAKFTTLKNIGKKNYPTQQLAYLRAGTGQCEFVIPASWEVPTPKVGHSPSTTASGYPVVRSLQKQGYYGLLVFRLPTRLEMSWGEDNASCETWCSIAGRSVLFLDVCTR